MMQSRMEICSKQKCAFSCKKITLKVFILKSYLNFIIRKFKQLFLCDRKSFYATYKSTNFEKKQEKFLKLQEKSVVHSKKTTVYRKSEFLE